MEQRERGAGDGAAGGGMTGAQRIVGIAVIVIAACLALASILARSQAREVARVPVSLMVSQSSLQPDKKSGKLTWVGVVENRSSAVVTAPWVKVSIYAPSGENVDTGEATTTVKTIPGRGTLSYITVFDTRGSEMRARASLEAPGSRPLGM